MVSKIARSLYTIMYNASFEREHRANCAYRLINNLRRISGR